MHRLILCLLTGFTVVFLPQYLLAEDPAGPPGPPQAQPAGPNPEILFNRLDANHDGFITQDELPPGMPEMFKQLLFLADGNGDGKITKEELTAALNKNRPGPENEPPFGPRFRGPMDKQSNAPDRRLAADLAADLEGEGVIWLGRRLAGREWDPVGWGGPGGRPGQMAGPPSRGPGEEPPQKPADADSPEGPVQVQAYSITKADPQTVLKVMQTLLAGKPDVRMDIDPKANNLIVLARPAEHAAIRATLAQMEHNAQGGTDAKEKPSDIAGPPFGRSGGGRGWMGGQGFGGPGMGRGWMGGQGSGGHRHGTGLGGSQADNGVRMGGQGFGGPGTGPVGWAARALADAGSGPRLGWEARALADQEWDTVGWAARASADQVGPGRMGGPPFGRGGPDGRPPQMAGRNFPGPNAGPPWMRGSHFNGPEQRPWAGPGYGPPHHWAAFEPMQQRPWQQYGHWGPPNRPWQQYGPWGRPNHPWQANFAGPNHHRMPPWMAPGMAYGPGPRRPWQPNGQNWYQQLLSYNARPHHPGMAYGLDRIVLGNNMGIGDRRTVPGRPILQGPIIIACPVG